jgi:hypothetical protein
MNFKKKYLSDKEDLIKRIVYRYTHYIALQVNILINPFMLSLIHGLTKKGINVESKPF